MSRKFSQISAAQIIKFALKSILFPSLALGLFGGFVCFLYEDFDVLPLMVFGFIAGFSAAVLINFSKIKQFSAACCKLKTAQ